MCHTVAIASLRFTRGSGMSYALERMVRFRFLGGDVAPSLMELDAILCMASPRNCIEAVGDGNGARKSIYGVISTLTPTCSICPFFFYTVKVSIHTHTHTHNSHLPSSFPTHVA
jgi:hypothetical protein